MRQIKDEEAQRIALEVERRECDSDRDVLVGDYLLVLGNWRDIADSSGRLAKDSQPCN